MPQPDVPPCRVVATRDEKSPVWQFVFVNDGDSAIEKAVLAAVKYEWGDQYSDGLYLDVTVTNLPPGGRAVVWHDDGGSEMRTDLWFQVTQAEQTTVLLFEFPKLYLQKGTTLVAHPDRMERLP